MSSDNQLPKTQDCYEGDGDHVTLTTSPPATCIEDLPNEVVICKQNRWKMVKPENLLKLQTFCVFFSCWKNYLTGSHPSTWWGAQGSTEDGKGWLQTTGSTCCRIQRWRLAFLQPFAMNTIKVEVSILRLERFSFVSGVDSHLETAGKRLLRWCPI